MDFIIMTHDLFSQAIERLAAVAQGIAAPTTSVYVRLIDLTSSIKTAGYLYQSNAYWDHGCFPPASEAN